MFTVELQGAEDVMRSVERFSQIAGRSLEEEIIAIGRLVAVSLAVSTQPYGKGKDARDRGQQRVETDIRKVFRTPSNVYQSLLEDDPSEARKFWRAITEGKISWIEKILRDNAIDLEVGPSPVPSYHDSARGRNGRVKGRARMMVTRQQELNRYIKKRQKMVGFAKSGWALAADDCGGHRGIPAWASSRHPGSHGHAIIRRDVIRPSILLVNSVRYVDEILPQREINTAIGIAYERAIKRYTIAMKKQAAAAFRRAA